MWQLVRRFLWFHMNDRLLLWTIGGFAMKKQMLDDRRFPKLHLNLQRLLQVCVTKPKAYRTLLCIISLSLQ